MPWLAIGLAGASVGLWPRRLWVALKGRTPTEGVSGSLLLGVPLEWASAHKERKRERRRSEEREGAGIYAFSSNDIKVGSNIEVDGAPWRVIEFLHVKPGKGAAFVRTKVRNYITGNTVEKTFRAGSTIQEADVVKETKQFTYKDGNQYVFMDLSTYEETRLGEKEIGDKTKWLKEGMDCTLLFWNGRVIDFDLPITVQLTVVDVDPGLKGDTAQGGSKPATLDTGAVVNVPLFVNIGDEILVDTRTGQYMSRA